MAEPAAPAAQPYRIDTHHHFFPPPYLEPLRRWAEQEGSGLRPPQRDWTIARDLEEMDRTGTATAILSISTPGTWFGDAEEARRLARLCNDYAAEMARNHPGRYGLFASLPMPDVEGCLREIEHAFDALKASGIGLMTSYAGKWPGDPLFAPVFEELNRRKAVVYFHPLAPDCCEHLMPYLPSAYTEWLQDTNRAVTSLLFSGALARYRDIRFLFSHAGGGIPMLAGRLVNMAKQRGDVAQIAPEGVEHELRRLYYDTANSTTAPTMAALLAFAPITQIVFGSDYPYYTIAENLDGLARVKLSARHRRAIERGNAARLLGMRR